MQPYEIEVEVNRQEMTGLNHGWQIAQRVFSDGQCNPTRCERDPTREH